MAKKIFYVVQPYDAAKRGNGLKAGTAMEVATEAEARRKAERLAQSRAGAIAFSRAVDPDSDDAEPPVLLASFGRVPEDLFDAA